MTVMISHSIDKSRPLSPVALTRSVADLNRKILNDSGSRDAKPDPLEEWQRRVSREPYK